MPPNNIIKLLPPHLSFTTHHILRIHTLLHTKHTKHLKHATYQIHKTFHTHLSKNSKPRMFFKAGRAILRWWHGVLNLERHSPPSWYRDRFREELQECREAKTPLEKLSETSDVFFAISRAKHDGFPVGVLPPFRLAHCPVYAYMFAKYTSRWAFYRAVAMLCGAPRSHNIREVVNPTKDRKLDEVARRHQIDPERFVRVAGRVRRVWPLFP